MMLKLLLPPAVWFHGAQSTITGGSSARQGATCRFICELAQIIPCVLITAFGIPVEPDVNRNLAIVSRPTWVAAAATSSLRRPSPDNEASTRIRGVEGLRSAITGTEGSRACCIAGPYRS